MHNHQEEGAKTLYESWEPYWEPAPNISGHIFLEKDPYFFTVSIKEQLFPGVASHIFLMRHPYTIMCTYGDSCGDAVTCLRIFVRQWLNILKRIQDGLKASVVCFEGFLEDYDTNARRNLDIHNKYLIDRKYMWKKESQEKLDECLKGECSQYVSERNHLDLFCGYDLTKLEINFKPSGNAVLATWRHPERLAAMTKVLEIILAMELDTYV